jgi:hypothetical protein
MSMREKLKSRRESFVIKMVGTEKSRVAIVRISVPHFDFIKSLFSGIPSGVQNL